MAPAVLMERMKSNAVVRWPKSWVSTRQQNETESTAGRQGEGMGCEVATAEMIRGGATIEDVPFVKAAVGDEWVDLATELEVVVEEAIRGVVPRSSVPRLLWSPTIVDISSNLAGARRFRPLLLLILKSVGKMYPL